MDLLDKIEDLIQNGTLDKASLLIKGINLKQIDRHLVFRFANLAQRAGLTMLALRAMHSHVHGDQSAIQPPTEAELVEYCFSLVMIGASDEALELLAKVDCRQLPKSFLYQAFAHISQWHYSLALPALDQFIETEHKNEEYNILVARLNRALALYYTGDLSQAKSSINELITELKSQDLTLLLAHSFELSAQILTSTGRFQEATDILTKADNILKNQPLASRIPLLKTKTILKGFNGQKKQALSDFRLLRQKAISTKQWEVVREIDSHSAMFSEDLQLSQNVFFATSFVGYRKYLVAKIGKLKGLPQRFVTQPPFSEKCEGAIVDLKEGSLDESTFFIKKGSAGHRLINALALDLYRPMRIASIHRIIYPQEHFNPLSSPTKIHQIVRRTRKVLIDQKVPITIQESEGSYRLQTTQKSGLLLDRNRKVETSDGLRIEHLKIEFGKNEFSARSAAHVLNLSLRSVNYLLEREAGRSVSIQHSGPQVMYKLIA